jgi:DNA-binding response OmpR family regulator
VKFAGGVRRLQASPKVLVVEDDAAIRRLVAAALRREPLVVDVAADGVEALELVAAHDYEVIVTDLMLPRLDGAEFVESFVRLRPEARSVVFVMTALDDQTAARRLGPSVHAIIRKPFDVTGFVEVIRECAQLRQAHEIAAAEQRMPPPQRLGDAC